MGKNWCITYWSYSFYYIWAVSRSNQQNGMCTQRRLRSAWASAQSSLATWKKLKSLAIIGVHSVASDQTGWMPRLIWVHWAQRPFFHEAGHFTLSHLRQQYWFLLFRGVLFMKLSEKVMVFMYPCTCMSPFIMSYCRWVVILTFIFHDSLGVSLFI